MIVYELSYNWWEDYTPYLFSPPINSAPNDQASWQALCDSLLDQAIDDLIKLQSDPDEYQGQIGWHDIVKRIVQLLLDKGWHEVVRVKAKYWGSIIIHDEEDLARAGRTADGDQAPFTLKPETITKLISFNNKISAGQDTVVAKWAAEDERKAKYKQMRIMRPWNSLSRDEQIYWNKIMYPYFNFNLNKLIVVKPPEKP